MACLRRSQILGGLAALALSMAALGAAPSAAAEGDKAPGKEDRAATSAEHCAVDATTGTNQCFDTFQESVAYATAGQVTDASLSASTGTADSKTTTKLNSGESAERVVIGVQYYWENFNTNPDGSVHQPAHTLTVWGDFGPCNNTLNDVEYMAAPLLVGDVVNWNNNIRSFEGHNNCWQQMWDNPDCTGLLLDWAPHSADLGAGRDRTECIEWS